MTVRTQSKIQNPKSKIRQWLATAWDIVWRQWLDFFWRLLAALARNNGRKRSRRRAFRLRLPVTVSAEAEERIRTLMALQEALGDWDAFSELGSRTRDWDSSFEIRPEETMALARRILELDLPFLDLGGVLPEGAAGERVEVIERL